MPKTAIPKIAIPKIALATLMAIAVATTTGYGAFKKVSLSELVHATEEILLVQVLEKDQVMDWMEGVTHPVPFQRLRCEVLHCMKGNRKAHTEVTFFVPGGTLPGGGYFSLSTAPAAEAYLQGETVVFLNANSRYAPPGDLGMNAGDHGIYQVRERQKVAALRAKNGSPIERNLPLSRFQVLVREAIARQVDGQSSNRNDQE